MHEAQSVVLPTSETQLVQPSTSSAAGAIQPSIVVAPLTPEKLIIQSGSTVTFVCFKLCILDNEFQYPKNYEQSCVGADYYVSNNVIFCRIKKINLWKK